LSWKLPCEPANATVWSLPDTWTATIVMCLVFDQLWGAPAAVEMKRTFISYLRLLAQLARGPLPGEKRLAIELSYSLRETINANFDKVRSLADGVLFERGSSRERDLALRSRTRQWRPQPRTLFVTRITLLKYRLQLPGFELPEALHVAQQEFEDRLAGILDGMANRLEGKASQEKDNFEDSVERLEQTLALSRSIESVTMSLGEEI
jgi:multidrug resistance protein MdtO